MKNYLGRIIVDQRVLVGKPVIKGTRIPVDAVLKRLMEGLSIQEILEDYPNLTRDDIKAALAYAAKLVRGDEIIPAIREQHAVSR